MNADNALYIVAIYLPLVWLPIGWALNDFSLFNHPITICLTLPV